MERAHDELEKNLQDSNETPMSFPLEFLKAITCNFSTESVIGEGGFGVVYKGILRCGKIIAVKKFFEIHLKEEMFQNEVRYLMGIKHQNVVQFLGYCAESSWEAIEQPSGSGKFIFAEIPKRLLCFEYVSNKSLEKHISDESVGLEWNMRYEIIKGICNGLHFLHEECRMVHLDLKPENILMDSTMTPKIADFGLSRIFGEQQSRIVTDNRAGTCGYMAPEYLVRGLVSNKADIFSLGVIFIEIITGHRDYPYFQQDSPHITATSVQQFTEKVVGSWRNKFVSTTNYKHMERYTQQKKLCVAIAIKCVDPGMDKRPTTKDIIKVLSALDQVEAGHELSSDIQYIEKMHVIDTTSSKDLRHLNVTEDMFRNETDVKVVDDAPSSELRTDNQNYQEADKESNEPQPSDKATKEGKVYFSLKLCAKLTAALVLLAHDFVLQITASSGELLDVHPLELCFSLEPNKLVPCSLHLTNNKDKQVVFRLMEKRYSQTCFLKLPLYGILPPRSTCTLIVTTDKRDSLPKERDVDLIMENNISDEYIEFFQRESDCDKYFEKAKRLKNLVHKVPLRAIYAQEGETTSEEKMPPLTKIISMEKTCEHHICSLDVNRTEPWIIAGHQNGYIDVWNYDTQKWMGLIHSGDVSPVYPIKFIERKQWFIAGSGNYINVYDYKTEVHKIMSFRPKRHLFGMIDSLAVHPTLPYVLSSCYGYIHLWDWDKNWECIRKFERQSHFTCEWHLAFNPKDANLFASASGNHTIKLWSLDSFKPNHTLSGHLNGVNCLDFFTSGDRQYLITGSRDKTAKIWDLQERTCVYTLKGFISAIMSVVCHPSLPILFTTTADGAIYLWSSSNFSLKRIFINGGSGIIRSLTCFMGSKRVVSASDCTLSIMEIQDEEPDAN